MFKYLIRQGWLPTVSGAGSLALYVCFIVACVGVVGITATEMARVGATALQRAAHEEWDLPKKTAERVSRSAVLDSNAFSFGYFRSERNSTTGYVPKKPLRGVRSGLTKIQPEQNDAWGFWGAGWGWNQPEQPPPEPVKPVTYRTMCVRLCDGAYFPVSFATPSDRFSRDEDICQKSCSSPAKLYVYRNPGGDVDQMRDVKGEPYSKLKSAFLFRTTYDASCTCKPNPWETAALEKHRAYAELEAQKKSKKAEFANRKQASRKRRGNVTAAAAPAAKPPAPVAVNSEAAKPEAGPDTPKVTIISSAPAEAVTEKPSRKNSKKRAAANTGPAVAGWSESADTAQKGAKARGASRSKYARAYDGSDWRMNVFQAN